MGNFGEVASRNLKLGQLYQTYEEVFDSSSPFDPSGPVIPPTSSTIPCWKCRELEIVYISRPKISRGELVCRDNPNFDHLRQCKFTTYVQIWYKEQCKCEEPEKSADSGEIEMPFCCCKNQSWTPGSAEGAGTICKNLGTSAAGDCSSFDPDPDPDTVDFYGTYTNCNDSFEKLIKETSCDAWINLGTRNAREQFARKASDCAERAMEGNQELKDLLGNDDNCDCEKYSLPESGLGG